MREIWFRAPEVFNEKEADGANLGVDVNERM